MPCTLNCYTIMFLLKLNGYVKDDIIFTNFAMERGNNLHRLFIMHFVMIIFLLTVLRVYICTLTQII